MTTQENLIVGSKLKTLIRDTGLRSDGELVDAVSAKVHQMMTVAMERAKQNGRSTVRPCDL